MQNQPINVTGNVRSTEILLHEDAGGYVLVAVISLYCGGRDYCIMYQIQKKRTKESRRRRSCIKERKGGSMKKKCFKKTVSWALSIVMSATMAVTSGIGRRFYEMTASR
ncbi:MAG: hypothetical protein ACLUKE_08285 [Blautia wexlerae]